MWRASVLTPEATSSDYVLPIHFSLDGKIDSKPRDRKIDLKIK